jgi:UDP-glucose:(heptosyl)LPS alpha-1,3-glucosyltransferase
MRLGLVRHKYKLGGGAETVLALLGKQLSAQGHEVHVITSDWQGRAPDHLELHQVEAGNRAAKWKRPWIFARAVRDKAAELSLGTWLSLERVPGAPVFRASDGCHAAWLQRRSRYEPWHRRLSFELNPFHRSLKRLELETVTKAGRVIAISRMVADELTRYCGLNPNRLRVIYNAVDDGLALKARDEILRDETRRSLGLEPGRPALLFLGSDYKRKGLGFSLEALAKLPDAMLLVAGGDKAAPFKARAQKLGLEKRVSFLGLRGDVPGLLAACDAFVLPTIYDPLSIAIMEALASGVPVVTSKGAGACELIQSGVSGSVVDEPADPDALSQAMQKALAMPKGFVSPAPSLDEWLKKTLAVIQETL